MLVNYVEWNCSECESKKRELCNIHMYGSPIRICKKCHAEHLDSRFREPALLGLTGTDDDKHWLEIFFSCLLLTAISFLWYILHTQVAILLFLELCRDFLKKLRRYGYKISEALIPPHKNMRSPKNTKSGKKEKIHSSHIAKPHR